MSRTLDTLLRPSLLAVAIALGAPLASPLLIAAEQASSVRAYNLPAAPLAGTLNQIASQAGIALSLDPSLASGRTSAPVNGQYSGVGALQAALRGTGLQLRHVIDVQFQQIKTGFAHFFPFTASVLPGHFLINPFGNL